MHFVSMFIVFCLGGIADTAYLSYTHYKKKSLVCPLDHDCSVVTESKWGSMFGIRTELLGFLFYGSLLAGILTSLFIPRFASLIHIVIFFAAAGGLLYSLFLVSIQIFVIKDYCFYCIISALLAFLLFVNSVLLL